MNELQNEDKLERLRTAVVVKTYSKLVHLYKLKPSVETEARMLKRVKAFSKALFKNISWNGEHAYRCDRACLPNTRNNMSNVMMMMATKSRR